MLSSTPETGKATESKATEVAIVRLMVPGGWVAESVSPLPPALSINAIRNYVILSSVYIRDEFMPRSLASSTSSRVFSRLFFRAPFEFRPEDGERGAGTARLLLETIFTVVNGDQIWMEGLNENKHRQQQ